MRRFFLYLPLLIVGAVMLFSTIAVQWSKSVERNRKALDYSKVSDDGTKLYTSRRYLTDLRSFLPDPNNDFAEITLRAAPCENETEVFLSATALETVNGVFGTDSEWQCHNIRAAVEFQIVVANVKGAYPNVERTSFKVEITSIRVSRNAGRELSGTLLTVAATHATGAFLEDWEQEQQEAADSGEVITNR